MLRGAWVLGLLGLPGCVDRAREEALVYGAVIDHYTSTDAAVLDETVPISLDPEGYDDFLLDLWDPVEACTRGAWKDLAEVGEATGPLPHLPRTAAEVDRVPDWGDAWLMFTRVGFDGRDRAMVGMTESNCLVQEYLLCLEWSDGEWRVADEVWSGEAHCTESTRNW